MRLGGMVALLLTCGCCANQRRTGESSDAAPITSTSAAAPAALQVLSPGPSAVASVIRNVPFDGGFAHVETSHNGAEHVTLHGQDGNILGESNCVAPLEGYDAVRAFFTDVRDAIVRRDAARAADFMTYPLRVNEVKTRIVVSREQFLSEQSKILTRDVVERVRAADPGRVFCNWQGQMLGDGVLWAEVQTNDRLGVWAINVGPGPKRRLR